MFDAVVIGEYERRLSGDQLLNPHATVRAVRCSVVVAGDPGPCEFQNPAHQADHAFGAQTEREALRSRFRVTAAMRAQVRDQGLFLGGRPPYGYRLVDAGPHPNAVSCSVGATAEPFGTGSVTAEHVRWMFAQR